MIAERTGAQHLQPAVFRPDGRLDDFGAFCGAVES
jgi:hypothetical protein